MLTDFERFERWYPFIPEAEGEVREGARLRVPLLWRSVHEGTRRGFEEMNAALKREAEVRASATSRGRTP